MAGTSYYRSAITSIAQNPQNTSALVICLAYLVLDDQNIHDQNAVRVVIGKYTVGHLPRDFAKTYRVYIRELPSHISHVSVLAAITNGITTKEKAYEYTIELDIPDNWRITPVSQPLEDFTTRVNGYAPLLLSADGSYKAKVWVPVSDFNDLHDTHEVDEWTTESWETINYYARNRQGIGLGFKLYEIPKKQYTSLFGGMSTSGKLLLDKGRFATLEIKLES